MSSFSDIWGKYLQGHTSTVSAARKERWNYCYYPLTGSWLTRHGRQTPIRLINFTFSIHFALSFVSLVETRGSIGLGLGREALGVLATIAVVSVPVFRKVSS